MFGCYIKIKIIIIIIIIKNWEMGEGCELWEENERKKKKKKGNKKEKSNRECGLHVW